MPQLGRKQPTPVEQQIAARAYEIWKQRGCPLDGDGKRDWYAASRELEAERERRAYEASIAMFD
jgi:hypothetical protein